MNVVHQKKGKKWIGLNLCGWRPTQKGCAYSASRKLFSISGAEFSMNGAVINGNKYFRRRLKKIESEKLIEQYLIVGMAVFYRLSV